MSNWYGNLGQNSENQQNTEHSKDTLAHILMSQTPTNNLPVQECLPFKFVSESLESIQLLCCTSKGYAHNSYTKLFTNNHLVL